MPAIGLQQVTPATPMEMLSRAMMSGAAPDVLEKLLALQERWENNQARKAFDEAIAAARAEIPPIRKNKTVSFGAGKTAYKHEDMAEIERTILPILSKHGINYRFRSTVVDKMIIVTCMLSKGGYREENSLPGPADTSGSKNAIQAIGSTVTYLQRYTLKEALGLSASDDDDAVSASNGNGNGNGRGASLLTDEQASEITDAIEASGRDLDWFCHFARINAISDLASERFDAALAYVKKLERIAQ
jgi:hypothetical protein